MSRGSASSRPADAAEDSPHGELLMRTFAFPRDANMQGDIFGGWLLGQMDLAGASLASRRAHGRVTTVSITEMTFKLPVFVGDELTCYGSVMRVGRTSVTIQVEAWARRHDGSGTVRVTEGLYTYVAIGADRRPRPVPPA